LGDKACLSMAFDETAALCVKLGRLEHAARLLGAAEALREAIGYPLSPGERREYDTIVATVRAGPLGRCIDKKLSML